MAVNILALAMPLVVLQVFDRVIPFQSHETLAVLFLGLCIVTVLDFVLKFARIVLLGSTGEAFEIDLGARFLDHTLGADPAEYERKTTGSHYERLGAVGQMRDHYSGQGRLLAVDLPFTIIFISMIWLIGGWLVLVPLSSFALLWIFKSYLQRAQAPVLEDRRTLDGRRYSFLIEFLSQIVTVKCQTMEPQMLRRYEVLQGQSVDISHKLIRLSGFSQSFGAIFSQAAVAAMGLFGGYLVIQGLIGMAELAACMLLNGRTVQPLMKMLGLWAQAENTEAAKSKLNELAKIPQRPTRTRKAELRGCIDFEAVSLKHPTRDEFIFQDLTASVPAGRLLAVLGPDGSGRGSLMRLLLGEIVPTKGRVLIDGHPAAEWSETRGPGGIGYIGQQPTIFQGSILDNVTLFGTCPSVDDAMELCSRLGVEREIHRLPLGYETLLGVNSDLGVTPAFLQRLSLARAIALKPRILLMNNPTTAMDSRAVAQVAAVLAEPDRDMTVVAASQRPKMLELADQVVHLSVASANVLNDWEREKQSDPDTFPAPLKRMA